MKCPSCQAEVFEIDVKCGNCGAALGATGAQRMIGHTVLGQYELVDVLGQGGMSVVFKARHKMTDQEVALKILPPELAAHSQVKSRFLEEAKALAALDHPNIVHLYNFGQENGSFVLAMQFVQGKTWERLILENKRLDWKTSCKITIDVLKALEYAHGRGVVHRDMKPSNVLVRKDDSMATVMDFGIAKMTTSTKLTATGQTMGTVRYMSPEQVRGQEVDLRTDIYSLGATLYESLVGDTPFDGSTHFEIMTKHLSEVPKRPSTLGVEVPKDIEDALIKSLSKRADDRFESARDMRKIIESVLRENDVALVDTQRFDKDVMAELRPAQPPARPTAPERPSGMPRAATASDLADALEPGTSGARTAKRGRAWLWIALAVIVLGGGGTGAALLVTGGKPHAYKAKTALGGVTLTAGKQFDKILVETDGKLTPDAVITEYRTALGKLAAFDTTVPGNLDLITAIVVVPAAALCDPSIQRMSQAPCAPSDVIATAAGPNTSTVRSLLVSDDPRALAHTMRVGVASAACDFQVAFLDPVKDETQIKTICEMTKRFAESK